MEENVTGEPIEEQANSSAQGEKTASPVQAQNSALNLGKFKSVDALLRAYSELEAEFTRRSQRLKALEDAVPSSQESGKEAGAPRDGEELYRAVNENEGVRARVLSDYLASLKGVPLLGGSGTGVTAPKNAPKTIQDAGGLALNFLRKH